MGTTQTKYPPEVFQPTMSTILYRHKVMCRINEGNFRLVHVTSKKKKKKKKKRKRKRSSNIPIPAPNNMR
jgi:hypothetical protein